MSAYRALAAAKVNLGLFVGPTRPRDGRHELVSVMQSISLADVLELAPAPAGAAADELECPGIAPAQNLAAQALSRFRERTGWDAPPLRLRIDKHIPIAAGLAGGSADAAATLRLARAASGLGSEELLAEIARGLGADVPAQLAPGRWLAGGAGERLTPLRAPINALELVLAPSEEGLSTASVFAEADRLGLPRSARELEDLRARLDAALARGQALPAERGLLHNDLQAAALSLRPQLAASLQAAREAGAEHALLCGSGPTVAALFSGDGAREHADAAASALAARTPPVIRAHAIDAGHGEPGRGDAEGDPDARLRNNPPS